jgi:hypothetical protein
MSRVGAAAKALAGLLPAPLDLQVVETLRWALRAEARRSRVRTREVFERLGRPGQVLGGPFQGMRFHRPGISAQGGYLPKLLGCYELECQPAIAELVRGTPETVVNIGAAEGYYAAGLLINLPRATAVCFEVEKPLHGATLALARRNGVRERLDVRGACTRSALREALAAQRRTVIMCDIEGGEGDLLDAESIPRLRDVAILVEVHERLAPGVSSSLRARFAASHAMTVIASRGRERSDVPAARALSPEAFRFATDEGRTSTMEWLLLVPQGW